MHRLRLLSCAFAALLVAMSLVPPAGDATAARGEASRSVVHARHGMVCAAQPLAVQAGVDVLRRAGARGTRPSRSTPVSR